MRRLLKIAWREYLAYVRTRGFWFSLLMLPVGLSLIVVAPKMAERSTPTPLVAIVDLTAHDLTGPVAQALAVRADGARPVGWVVPAPGAPFSGRDAATAALRPYLTGPRPLPGGGQLDLAAIIWSSGDRVTVDYWSRDVASGPVQTAIGEAVKSAVRSQRLRASGVDPGALKAIDAFNPDARVFSPKAEKGVVALKDLLPGMAGAAIGYLLWMVVLTGAGMLLNSVIEEKNSRILEVLLTSASVPEIMGGKILGVAAVTGTILTFWITIAAILLTITSPGMSADVAGFLLGHGRWAYFALYFVGGYLMFATFYVTLGAFCETPRETQTLQGPLMIIMSIPLMFMSLAFTHPDAAILHVLSWVPLFTPFVMAARAGADPPLWEIIATAALMFSVTALELWVAVPAFRSGALATGRFELKTFVRTLTRRGAA